MRRDEEEVFCLKEGGRKNNYREGGHRGTSLRMNGIVSGVNLLRERGK